MHPQQQKAVAQEDDGHAHETGGDDAAAAQAHSFPPPLGFSLSEGWLDTWAHSDFSRRGTPFIHLFGLEPAFLDRDVFFDFVHTSADEEDETEVAVELEFALNRRLGVAVEP